MKSTFNPDAFIQGVGRRLVEEFEIARTATSPSTVGAAMEQPVRKQLEQILPRGIGVGSGFVIDTYGETSRQIDIVLYEKKTSVRCFRSTKLQKQPTTPASVCWRSVK